MMMKKNSNSEERYVNELAATYQHVISLNRGHAKLRGREYRLLWLLLEAIEGVDHIENLSMRLRAISPTGEILDEEEVDENRPLDSSMPQYALIFSGEHQIVVKPLG